ncbi:LacI family DNA-binding transcriptional regulator [Paenibacillus xerothermodurans]|uniref:LacI family transcriptional regulator n=1 Tax=Paenibacillus xerothermodurans TaxID=1977292 RepID=A0A2W1NDH7_PAEXE|nr:LacI family DNA-binding transcriptional regulator [Paenibacillus xerothermodurans]PZE21670.1 LacI family transcriptional regulator [Paenibacillus xerothermodurans]
MKITIKDVATEAGVSIATVSRVLNKKNRVKQETKLRVQQAIHKLNFQPDHTARSMIMKETRTVGLIVPNLSNEYWALLAEVIQDKLWEHGYSLIVCSTNKSADKEMAFVKSFTVRRVDGVVFGSSTLFGSSRHDEQLANMLKSLPTVSIDPSISGLNSVVGDNLQGATDAVEHLIGLGHRRIAYIGGPTVSKQRELGYRNAMMNHELPVLEELIKRGDDNTIAFSSFGYHSMLSLLESGEKFTAVFCGNDLIAIGAIRALEDRRIQVPADISVIGYDDINIAALYKPSLTTVRQPMREMGSAAVDMLLELIQCPDGNNVPKKIVYQNQLVQRESSGPAR